MTKRERAQILKAIRLLASDGTGFEEGMGILFKMAGMSDPADKLKGLKTIPIEELCRYAGDAVNKTAKFGTCCPAPRSAKART